MGSDKNNSESNGENKHCFLVGAKKLFYIIDAE